MNKIALAVVCYFNDLLNESQIVIEVSVVRLRGVVESHYPNCDYHFIWSIDSDEHDFNELVTTLDLSKVTVREDNKEALPQGDVESAVRLYAKNALETMNFQTKTVVI